MVAGLKTLVVITALGLLTASVSPVEYRFEVTALSRSR
jgi:hypothetical protein